MKPVLQYGSLAGWPFTLAEALRELGVPSVNVIPDDRDWKDLDRGLPHHLVLAERGQGKLAKALARAKFMWNVPRDFSLVHYHSAHFFRPSLHPMIEGRMFHSKNIPMLLSFAGSDVRIVSEARRNNPYFFRDADLVGDERRRKYLRDISKYVRFVATDCEIAEYVAPYFEKVFLFRQPVSLDKFQFSTAPTRDVPVLLHVPTDVVVKGTEYVFKAIELLKAEGLKFEFRTKRQLTQTQFYKELSDCDVYIDQIRCGSHGVTAVESMAMGKATVTYIRPDLVSKYPADMPLVNANPDTIADVLRELITDRAYRDAVSARSRPYVEKYHDARIIAADMLDTYREIGY